MMAWKKHPFKNGQKVMIRPDNSVELWCESHNKGEYENAGYVGDMDEWRGRIVTVRTHRKDYAIFDEDTMYGWSWISFMPLAEDKPTLNKLLLNGEIDIDTYHELSKGL